MVILKERLICPTQWKAEEMRTTSTLGCSNILWIVLSLKKNKPHNWWRGFLYIGKLGWATSINEPHATGDVPTIQTLVKSLVHVPNVIHKWMWTKRYTFIYGLVSWNSLIRKTFLLKKIMFRVKENSRFLGNRKNLFELVDSFVWEAVLSCVYRKTTAGSWEDKRGLSCLVQWGDKFSQQLNLVFIHPTF